VGDVVFLSETNSILRVVIEIDAMLLLHSNLGPEKMIDRELEICKELMLDTFYSRFPGARNANT
jgi:hypothetical protein